MARLTQFEKRLLRYPPTPSTYECLKVRVIDGVRTRCSAINPGSALKCWVCGNPKPRRPLLIWAKYEAACKKAGINPGDRWRESDQPATTTAQTRVRRKKQA